MDALWAVNALLAAAVLGQATAQLSAFPEQPVAPAPAQAAKPKALATPSAVAQLASALLSVATPESPAPVNPVSNLTLPYRPGSLLIKFQDLDGENYTQIVDLVNQWAGIDLVKVSQNLAHMTAGYFPLSPCRSTACTSSHLSARQHVKHAKFGDASETSP